MSSIGVLSAVAAFLAALAVLYATGRWRPEHRSLRPRKMPAAWSTPPASRFLISWVLVAVTMVAMSATDTTAVWAVPLLFAGLVVAHAGLKIVRNAHGWADTLARLTWTGQGIGTAFVEAAPSRSPAQPESRSLSGTRTVIVTPLPAAAGAPLRGSVSVTRSSESRVPAVRATPVGERVLRGPLYANPSGASRTLRRPSWLTSSAT